MDRLFRHVPRPELAADHLPNLGEGRIRDSRGVGSHISYQADKPFLADLDPFVQLLRQLHGLLDREAQLARGFLLQLRSDKRRDRVALFLSGRDRRDDEALALQFGQYVARLLLFFYMDLALLEGFADRFAVIVQYSVGTKARISRSRSTTSRNATDWTRPADSPRLTLSQSKGLT